MYLIDPKDMTYLKHPQNILKTSQHVPKISLNPLKYPQCAICTWLLMYIYSAIFVTVFQNAIGRMTGAWLVQPGASDSFSISPSNNPSGNPAEAPAAPAVAPAATQQQLQQQPQQNRNLQRGRGVLAHHPPHRCVGCRRGRRTYSSGVARWGCC